MSIEESEIIEPEMIAGNPETRADSSKSAVERFVMCLLALTAKYDVNEEIMWSENLDFAVLCNDAFWWGTADAEAITPKTLPELEQALIDGGTDDGMILYCARRRKLRPQGAMYKYIKKPELFNVFPERIIEFGNPVKP